MISNRRTLMVFRYHLLPTAASLWGFVWLTPVSHLCHLRLKNNITFSLVNDLKCIKLKGSCAAGSDQHNFILVAKVPKNSVENMDINMHKSVFFPQNFPQFDYHKASMKSWNKMPQTVWNKMVLTSMYLRGNRRGEIMFMLWQLMNVSLLKLLDVLVRLFRGCLTYCQHNIGVCVCVCNIFHSRPTTHTLSLSDCCSSK